MIKLIVVLSAALGMMPIHLYPSEQYNGHVLIDDMHEDEGFIGAGTLDGSTRIGKWVFWAHRCSEWVG
jgi:hypothetical protein